MECIVLCEIGLTFLLVLYVLCVLYCVPGLSFIDGIAFACLMLEFYSFFQCAASADSFSNYGQNAVSDSAHGHILVSAATALSTMDFSMLPLNHDVVDSPPNGGKHVHLLKSHSPLRSEFRSSSPDHRVDKNVGTQRKLYDDKIVHKDTLKVWILQPSRLYLVLCM